MKQNVDGWRTLYSESSWMLVPNTVTGTAPLSTSQLACAAFQQRCPISARNEIQEKHGRLGRILLRRVDVIAVVRGVFGRIVCADLNTVDQHAHVLEDLRALGGRYESMNGSWPLRSQKVEDEVRLGSARGSAPR